MKNILKIDYLIVAGIAAAIFIYFSFMTVSEYKLFPKGDAKTYTIMALHFDNPERVTEELSTIYAQRIFPAFIAFAFSSPFRDKALLKRITTPNKTQTFAALPLDSLVRKAWRVSNFIAFFIQLLFIYLLLSHFKIDRGLTFYMLIIYSSWFLSVRVYTNWIQMPDPWAFAFLAAGAYYTVKKNTAGFIISITLGVLCKETLLFMVPTYIWRILAEDGIKKKSVVEMVLAGAIPPIVFFSHRLHPYFASAIVTPNAPAEIRNALSGGSSFLADYFFLIKYHFIYRLNIGSAFFLDIALIILGTFAGISAFLLFRIKDFYLKLKEMKYWIPFLFLTLLTGFNIDRYLFYAFPVVILLGAMVLNERYSGRTRLIVMLFIFAVTVWHHEAWLYFGAETGLDLTIKHQLELAVDYNQPFANMTRIFTIKTIIATIVGLSIIELIKRKLSRPENAL